jgi:short-subunit dehydrogenase
MSQTSVDRLNTKSNTTAFIMNVTKEEDVQSAVDVVEKSGLEVAAVINNAGISAFGYCEFLPMDRYKANAEVNYFGAIRVTKKFLPLLRKSKGRLINMGSMGDRMPSAFGSAYLSTKAALASFSDCVRQEVHRFGVQVCSQRHIFWCLILASCFLALIKIKMCLPFHCTAGVLDRTWFLCHCAAGARQCKRGE